MKFKYIFLFFILLIFITGFSFIIINILEKNDGIEKIEFTNNNMIKFEIEEKPEKIIPYKQKTDSERYRKHLYEYFDKIDKARDKPIKK